MARIDGVNPCPCSLASIVSACLCMMDGPLCQWVGWLVAATKVQSCPFSRSTALIPAAVGIVSAVQCHGLHHCHLFTSILRWGCMLAPTSGHRPADRPLAPISAWHIPPFPYVSTQEAHPIPIATPHGRPTCACTYLFYCSLHYVA